MRTFVGVKMQPVACHLAYNFLEELKLIYTMTLMLPKSNIFIIGNKCLFSEVEYFTT